MTPPAVNGASRRRDAAPRRLSVAEIGGVVDPLRRAELAGNADLAVVADHVATLLAREAHQHRLDALRRAAADVAKRALLEDLDAALMKEAIEQPLARQRRVDQFVIFDRADQRAGLRPGLILGDEIADRPFRRIAGIEVGLAATLDRFRQELRHQAAGSPVRGIRRYNF